MSAVRYAFRDIKEAHFLSKFPTKNFFIWLMLLFYILMMARITSYIHPQQMASWFAKSSEYTILAKLMPGLIPLFVMTIYNIIRKKPQEDEPYNRLGYFIASIVLLVFSFAAIFIATEFIGAISMSLYQKAIKLLALGGNAPINFFFRGGINFAFITPAVALVTYYIIVLSNYTSRVLYRTFRRK